MKIAILTFHDALNYGAALQSFALKHVMSRDAQVQLLNYYNPYFHRNNYREGAIGIVKRFFSYWSLRRKRHRFLLFQKKYLTGNSPYLSKKDLSQTGELYDKFVTGSDQVWNLECSGGDKSYFLDFVNDGKKKFSYAASFGTTENLEFALIISLLKDFNQISVRENSGKEIIHKMLNLLPPVVLDPTMLLKKEEWAELFNLQYEEKYVLVYEVVNSVELFAHAKSFAKKKGFKLICITSSNYPKFGCKTIRDAGPIEWMWLFSKAAYVFTNSFHGIVFSILFEKQYYVELLPPPSTTNTRMIELQDMLNLKERQLQFAYSQNLINYKVVMKTLTEKRIISLEFINSITHEKL